MCSPCSVKREVASHFPGVRLLLVILFFQHFNGVTTIRLTIGAVDIGFEAWIVGADFRTASAGTPAPDGSLR